MDKAKLRALYDLLTEYVEQPDWNQDGAAWGALAEAHRQVLIDLREAGVDPAAEDPEP